jgi:hypothetical protein
VELWSGYADGETYGRLSDEDAATAWRRRTLAFRDQWKRRCFEIKEMGGRSWLWGAVVMTKALSKRQSS